MFKENEPRVIAGRVGRRANNALTMTFADGPGEPVATARQSGGDGFGTKLAVALGMRNHGPGRHTASTRDGDALVVTSGYGRSSPSTITRNGQALATMVCGATTVVSAPSGEVLLLVESDSERASTADADRMVVRGTRGETVARIDQIMTRTGWDVGAGELLELGLMTVAGGLGALLEAGPAPNTSLPIRILGTRLVIPEPLPTPHRDLLLGLCIDLAIGGRAYTAAT